MFTGGTFPEIKEAGGEIFHSPPSSSEVTNVWSYISTPPYVFMAWCLVRREDNSSLNYGLLNHFSTQDAINLYAL
jgi:hypothetical protein